MVASNATAFLYDRLKLFLSAKPEYAHLLAALPALHLEINGKLLRVTFTHSYFAAFFNQHLRTAFEKACAICATAPLEFSYGTLKNPSPVPRKLADKPSQNPFASFFCNSRNLAALECAKKLCTVSQQEPQLAIFYGAPGSGKSHLLSLIAAALAGSESAEIVNCRAEAFTTPLAPERFWKVTRALILDDLQDVACQPALQKLLSVLIDCGRQSDFPARMVFSLPDRDTRKFNARFSQRLEQGLFIELFPADFSLRLAYAEKQARELQLPLSRTQLLGIARHHRNISAIAGILQKFKFYVNLQDQFPDEQLLEKLPLYEAREPAWQQALLRVAAKMGVKPADIIGKSKRQEFVLARQAAMHICRLKFGLSYPELGRVFGGRDHATVMHGIKKIQQLRRYDKVLHTLLTELEQEEYP